MKILTILLILLQINTFSYGNYSSPYSNSCNSRNSLFIEQQHGRIGYTTDYGNTFGYTTQQTYSNIYTQNVTQTYSPQYTQVTRKALGDRGSAVYSGTEISDDGTVTVTWSIEGTDILGIGGKYKIYVDGVLVAEGWMWTSTAKNTAQEKAKELANELSYSVPIDDTIVPLLILLFLYIGYDIFKKKHNKL